MMIHYSLSKLRTKQVTFHQVFAASDSKTLEELKDLSSKRRAIQESMDESSSITDAIAREMSGGLTSRLERDIQKLEHYLPLLENLVWEVTLILSNPPMPRLISELKLRWTSSLTSSPILHSKCFKYYQINDLRFEYGMVLFLYSTLLRANGIENLPKDLALSATLLRKAAGVYQYLAQQILPALNTAKATERPPESISSVSSVMSLVCLAEAQAATARKAEEKGNSVSLLAKLHCGVRDLLDEASGILHSAKKECKNISSHLADFIGTAQVLHNLKSHKYLAESLQNEGKIGVAIGVLHRAIKDVGKNSPKDDSWRAVYKHLIQETVELKRKYEHENEFVWHQRIPIPDDLPSPESVKLVSAISYQSNRVEQRLHFKT
ncbi:OLC1v1032372C1 [Oldenlandia corymbosa var. corymbosa]|uniref:OLC1v1032372C1 n=1 Tax=Oldenlandia corymbosa var. corymbosa TaxID=529605 RepID=A0AAV1CLM0_OLDCO|nr:OLC1v1032372C1 [Oldenlandia corymbosa var. corymbosa]